MRRAIIFSPLCFHCNSIQIIFLAYSQSENEFFFMNSHFWPRFYCNCALYLFIYICLLDQCFSTGGSHPLLGRGHLLLGRQNLEFSSHLVLNRSPNCVFSFFLGRQLPNVENHCSRLQK